MQQKNEAETRATIEELDREAQNDPAAYQRQLVMLALLAYAYVFIISIGLLLLVAFILWVLWHWHLWFLFKLSWLLLITVWIVAKSMWVKLSPGEGVRITPNQAPALFELIAQVREVAKSPKIHEVLINDQFNCGISEFPRLGLFGFRKNILVLGLPLMESLSEKEFASVLGHEMGHLSERHGRVSCWIHHVYVSWIQIYINLERAPSLGNSLFKKFAEWFVPYFDVRTLALRRVHEYAADQIAATISGPETTAQALITTAIKGDHLQEKFWPSIMKQAQASSEPPKEVFARLSSSLHEPLASATVFPLLKRNWRKHELMDSHPALSERVHALLPDKDWSDLLQIANEIASTSARQKTSAEALFGPALTHLRSQVDGLWHKNSMAQWQAEHELLKTQCAEFTKLEELFNNGELTPDQVTNLANACSLVKEPGEAMEFLQKLIDRYPNEADPHFLIGLLMLEDKPDDGILRLEKAMELRPLKGFTCCAVLAQYMEDHDRTAEAEQYSKRGKEYEEKLLAAQDVLTTLTATETFEEHKFDAAAIERLCQQIHAQTRIKEAYLVSKVLPEIVAGTMNLHVLVVTFVPSLWKREEEQTQTLQALAKAPECADFFIAKWDNIPPNLRDACKNFPNALIYDRATYKPQNVEAPEPATALTAGKHPAAPNKSFGASNRSKVMVACVGVIVGVLVAAVFGGKRTANQESIAPNPAPEQTTVQYNDYSTYMDAVQKKIKAHWSPPKEKQSMRVVVLFKVQRDGKVKQFRIKQSSGNPAMDDAARSAVAFASPFSPLPPGKEKSVDVEITLDYNVHKRPLVSSDGD